MHTTRVLTLLALFWGAGAVIYAQPAAVWAGANDAPNTLITGVFDGATMTYLPEVPSGGSSAPPGPGFVESQVRVFAGKAQGRCSLLAQTNPNSANVAIYTVASTGAATHVPGSPFPTGASSTTLAWARDGEALYVSRSVTGPAAVGTFRVSCTPGGPVSVSDAGPVPLGSLSGLQDLDLSGSGSHLCATSRNSDNAACYAIDPVTRLPSSTPVNVVTATGARGLRIAAANGCGVMGMDSNQVRGLLVSGTGVLTFTNTVTQAFTPPFHGAVSPDGSFAAFGTVASPRRVALYTIAPATCQITLVGATDVSTGPGAPYVAFDGANRLYVADVWTNQIRVFQATPGGPGTAISTTTTNHSTVNPPVGIDAALLSAVPVELLGFAVE